MSLQSELPPTLPTVVESEDGGFPAPVYYSEELAERIVRHYREGKSLHKISRLAAMPDYNVILRWVQENHEFRAKLEAAKSARALHLENAALQTADETYAAAKKRASTKDRIAAARLRFDALRWGAEVNDPSRYGKKVTHEGNPDKPLVFQVNTGFPEPNEYQRQPKLGADGLIERKPQETKIVDAEIVEENDGKGTTEAPGGPTAAGETEAVR